MKKGKFNTEFKTNTENFDNYLKKTQSENLVLRYHLLRSFIDETKTKMLEGYQQPEIDLVILTCMKRFMKEKGVDTSSLPLTT